MSTYINGLKFKNTNINQVLNFFHKAENHRRSYAKDKLKKLFLRDMFQHLDSNADIHKNCKKEQLKDVKTLFSEFKKHVIDISQSVWNDEHDISYEFVLFPFKRNVYAINCSGLFWTEYNHNLLKNKEYRYWNNTDAPDNISEKQWDERKKEWDGVLNLCGYSEVLCNNGLLYKPTIFDELTELSTHYKDYKLLIETEFNKINRIDQRLKTLEHFRPYSLQFFVEYYDHDTLKQNLQRDLIEFSEEMWNM